MEEFEDYGYETKELEQWQVDKYIETILKNEQELEKYKDILDRRIEDLKRQFNVKKDKIERENHFLMDTLKQFALNQEDLKSTKTQFKWEGLSGDIIIKKSLPKTRKPSGKKVENLEKIYPELIDTEVEEVKKLSKENWDLLKSKIIVQNGVPYDQESGENLSEFIDVEISEEKVQIK